ncbi:MAG: hypothetical protein ACREJG_05615, partial [Candidatus Rokuibacteriota bacterium]
TPTFAGRAAHDEHQREVTEMKPFLISLALLVVSAGVGHAAECPLLQAQIDKVYGKRFDRQASSVRSMASEAWALHKAGKHVESERKYDEAAKAGGMELVHKK